MINFVFFSNSDDEAVGFWDSWTEPFMSQIDLIKNLQKYFEEKKKEHLYVRIHPNLVNKSIIEQAKWDELKSGHYSTIYGAKSNVSSYNLLRGAKGVISYGSTIGLEAAFHHIPSAILADCWYDELGVADKLSDLPSIHNWIENIDQISREPILAERKRNSLYRGLWLELSGATFEYSVLKELTWGSWEAEQFCQTPLLRSRIHRPWAIFSNKIKRRIVGLSA